MPSRTWPSWSPRRSACGGASGSATNSVIVVRSRPFLFLLIGVVVVFGASVVVLTHPAHLLGSPQLCEENGNVVLGFGAPEYVGLGFSVIAMSTFLQFFGSPFLKSTYLFWGLMFGCLCAGVFTYEGKRSRVEPQPSAASLEGET